jgi:endonuclease-3
MSITIRPTKHLMRVYELLIRTYGEPKNEPDYDPLGGLIGTILSQHTSDINSDRAYKQLITTFPTWEDVRDAPTYLVAEAIRSGGLANIKARRIQDALLMLTELQQEQEVRKLLSDYLYDELTRRTSEDAWHFLRKMHGVGPKTAACVLMFNFRGRSPRHLRLERKPLYRVSTFDPSERTDRGRLRHSALAERDGSPIAVPSQLNGRVPHKKAVCG